MPVMLQPASRAGPKLRDASLVVARVAGSRVFGRGCGSKERFLMCHVFISLSQATSTSASEGRRMVMIALRHRDSDDFQLLRSGTYI